MFLSNLLHSRRTLRKQGSKRSSKNPTSPASPTLPTSVGMIGCYEIGHFLKSENTCPCGIRRDPTFIEGWVTYNSMTLLSLGEASSSRLVGEIALRLDYPLVGGPRHTTISSSLPDFVIVTPVSKELYDVALLAGTKGQILTFRNVRLNSLCIEDTVSSSPGAMLASIYSRGNSAV